MTKMINIRSLATELPGGREVRLGWNTDDPADDRYYVLFKNGDQEMKFKMSAEALTALIELKPSVDLYWKTGSMFQWRLVEKMPTEESPLDA